MLLLEQLRKNACSEHHRISRNVREGKRRHQILDKLSLLISQRSPFHGRISY